MHTFKALGWLLTYPESELVAAAPDAVRAIASEGLLSGTRVTEVATFAARLSATNLIDLQEEYTTVFDRGRATSLHLFEHVHGESRDRGQAMVELMGLYRGQGLEMPGNELPDYLPLFLEYLSVLPLAQAKQSLEDASPILVNLHAALARKKSRHAVLVHALLDLAGAKALADTPGIPEEDIDAQWAEEPVTFGPQSAPGCAKADDMVRRMQQPSEEGVRR